MSSRVVVALCTVVWSFFPAAAQAQWYVAGYLGANHTLDAPVVIQQPARDTSLTFSNATFDAHPFESPQYYGVRGGRLFGEGRRFGVEFEWFHPKVYADPAHAVQITGRLNGATVDTTAPMGTIVQHYAMSHGMNFVLINAVMRLPLADEGQGVASRVALTGRAGAGPTVPHAENTVEGRSREQYEGAGVGYQFAGGIDVRLVGRLSTLIEYKFNHARPEVTIVDGTGQTTVNMHQVAFGLAVGLAR